jgi:two-component system, LytTR family, sensor kinase
MNLHAHDKIRLKSAPSLLFRRVVYHCFFWMLVGASIFIIDRSQGQTTEYALIGTSISILFYLPIVYINLEYLIPRYLTRSMFLNYVGLLIAVAVIVTPIKVLVLYFAQGGGVELRHTMRSEQIVYLFTSLLFSFGSTFLRMMTDWVRYQQERREAVRQRMETELNFLKSQINPHFLFNTLNSLYALTLRKSDQAPEIVIKLSEMLRYMLYECNEPTTPLNKELTYLRSYLELEKLRHGDRMQLVYEETGQTDYYELAPLMLIPFVENAFKHGLGHSVTPGQITIQIKVDQGRMFLLVKNSKPSSLPGRPTARSGGIGLVNVRRRLELLYPGRYKLDIDDAPQTYTVHFELQMTEPLLSEKAELTKSRK